MMHILDGISCICIDAISCRIFDVDAFGICGAVCDIWIKISLEELKLKRPWQLLVYKLLDFVISMKICILIFCNGKIIIVIWDSIIIFEV